MKSCFKPPTVAIIIGACHSLINIVAVAYFISPIVALKHHKDGDDPTATRMKIICYTGAASSIMGVFLCALMVTGVVMKRYKLIAPYVHFGLVGLIGSGLLWAILIGYCIWNVVDFDILCKMFTRAILTEGLQILLWFPVFTLYKKWKVEATGGRILAPQQMNDPIPNDTYQHV